MTRLQQVSLNTCCVLSHIMVCLVHTEPDQPLYDEAGEFCLSKPTQSLSLSFT